MSSLSCSSLPSRAVRADEVETRTRNEKPRPAVAAALVLAVGETENSPTRCGKRCREGTSRGVLGLIESPFYRHAKSHHIDQ